MPRSRTVFLPSSPNPAARRLGLTLLTSSMVFALVGHAPATQAHDPESMAAEHIERLRAELADLAGRIHPNLEGFATQLGTQLEEAESARRGGLLLAALGTLRQVQPSVAGVVFHTEHNAEVDTVPEFTALVDRMAPGIAARAAALTDPEIWAAKPIAVQALGLTTAARVETLLQGGRAFGVQAGDIIDGLVYFGMAEGAADFAGWLGSLPVVGSGEEPAFPGLEAGLARLDRSMLTAYTDPDAQLESHASFIGVSSALKIAGELVAADLRPSAVLAYLEAERAHAEIAVAGSPGDLGFDELARLEIELTGRMEQGGVDHSIGALYLEQARQRLLEAREREGEAADTAASAAAVLLRAVVPGYLGVVAGDSVPVADAPAPEVTVTLVRWPFT